MANERACPRCGRRWTSTDPADTCDKCGAVIDWRNPHSNPIVDRDDEEVVENAGAVRPPQRG